MINKIAQMGEKRKRRMTAGLGYGNVIPTNMFEGEFSVQGQQGPSGPNPNVIFVAAPDQAEFQEQLEWILPGIEAIGCVEKLTLGKQGQIKRSNSGI